MGGRVSFHRRDVLAGVALSFAAPARTALARDEGPIDLRMTPNQITRLGVRLHINDQGPFIFVIDTGAGRTTVSRSVADALALPARAPLWVHGTTGAEEAPGVGLDRLVIKRAAYRNLHCPVFEDDRLAGDGLLGLDVLGRYRLGFDMVRRGASLILPGLRVATGSTDMQTGSRLSRAGVRSVRNRFGQMVMTEILVDDQPVSAFIDSGSQYSIGNLRLRDAVAGRRGGGRGFSRPVRVHGVTSDTLDAEVARVSRIRFGEETVRNAPLLFADLHCFEPLELADRPALLIGSDLLSCFRMVLLDFPESRIIFNRRRPGRTPLDLAIDGAV